MHGSGKQANMGGASGYIISCPATASQISSLQRQTPFFADSSLNNSEPRGFLQGRFRPAAQFFRKCWALWQRLRWYFSWVCFTCDPIQFWLKQRVPSAAWRRGLGNGDSGLCISPGPLEGPLLAKARHDPRHGTQKEGCHDKRFQQGLGSAMRGQTDLRSLVRREVEHAHQLPRNASTVSGLSILPAGHSGTPCASTLRQPVRGVIHKSSGWPRLKAMLTNDFIVWAQNNLRSLKATHVPGKINQGADMLSRNNVSSEEWTFHPLAVQRIWEVFGRARVDLSLPNIFYKEHGCPCPRMVQPSRSMLSLQSLCYRRYSGESRNNRTSWF